MVDFPERYKHLWNEWEIRFLVVFSLFLQLFLTLLAPLRKRRKTGRWMRPLIWLAYLLADWVAAFALGILSSAMHAFPHTAASKARQHPFQPSSNVNCTNKSGIKNEELVALWAPFLLVHLGGPDTITALALEDNELWLRHLLVLFVHLTAATYVFVLALPSIHLLVPTLLVFLVGIIRYTERTRALYGASTDGLHRSMPAPPDPGTKYARLMDVCTHSIKMGIPASISFPREEQESGGREREISEDPGQSFSKDDDGVQLVISAHNYFTTFKRLVLDHLILFRERAKSRAEFLRLPDSKHAFAIIEMEFRLLYDIRYTKAAVIHRRSGYITRSVCFACILLSLFIFLSLDKCGYHQVDQTITLTLLIGGLLLDAIGFFHLLISDRMIYSLATSKSSMVQRLIKSALIKKFLSRSSRMQPAIYVSQYNLISYCLRRESKALKFLERLPVVDEFFEDLLHTREEPVIDEFKDIIFEAIREKATMATSLEEAKELASCTSQWAATLNALAGLPEWMNSVEFEERVLVWHIATELCYRNPDSSDSVTSSIQRRFSKCMSDYMHYLLVMKPKMIASLDGLRQTKYQEACAQARSFIKDYKERDKGEGAFCDREGTFCEKLFGWARDLQKDERTQFVLFDACLIAIRLMGSSTPDRDSNTDKAEEKMQPNRMWQSISKIWVELLAHAASRCSAKNHTEQLVSGGELISTIWLMMTHMGIGERFRVESSRDRAKVFVTK